MKRSTALLMAAGLLGLYWWIATSVSNTAIGHHGRRDRPPDRGLFLLDDRRLPARRRRATTCRSGWRRSPSSSPGLQVPHPWTRTPGGSRTSGTWASSGSSRWATTSGGDAQGRATDDRPLRRRDGRPRLFLGEPSLRRAGPCRPRGGASSRSARTMLANGALVTSDMTATLHVPRDGDGVLGDGPPPEPVAGRPLRRLSLGLLCVSKFSAPLIAPMCAILWVVRILSASGTLDAAWPFPARIAGRARIASGARRFDPGRLRAGDRRHLGVVRVPLRHVQALRAEPHPLARRLGRP